MKWDLEERTEDAIVSYLRAAVTGDMRVYAAWDVEEPEMPCAMVHAESSEPVSDESEWYDYRAIDVKVAVMCEAVSAVDSSGVIVRTPRDVARAIRSDVMDAIGVSDLKAQIIAQEIDDIAFSMVQLMGVERGVDGRTFVSTFSISVIAEPVTGS